MDYSVIKEQIRSRVKMRDVVEVFTGAHISRGRCHCPLHTEKTPSFYINDVKNVFYCQGCGTGGDIFTFVQKYNNVSFVESMRLLDSAFNLGLMNDSPSNKTSTQATYTPYKYTKKGMLEELSQLQATNLELDRSIYLEAIKTGLLDPFSDEIALCLAKLQYIDYKIEEGMQW